MRALFSLLLLTASLTTNACMLADIIEPECERDPDACVRRDLRQLFERADVAFEVTVQTVSRPFLNGQRRSLNSVAVEHIWKSDGKPLDLVTAGWGQGDCSVRLSAGQTYVIFASRGDSRWSFLPWVPESLYAGLGGTFERSEFKAESPYHAEFYESKTPQAIQNFLEKLAR